MINSKMSPFLPCAARILTPFLFIPIIFLHLLYLWIPTIIHKTNFFTTFHSISFQLKSILHYFHAFDFWTIHGTLHFLYPLDFSCGSLPLLPDFFFHKTIYSSVTLSLAFQGTPRCKSEEISLTEKTSSNSVVKLQFDQITRRTHRN